MAKAMTKAQIVDKLAKATGLTKKATAQVLDELAALAYRQAKNGFTLPGVGKIEITRRKARKGRNPITNEVIRIPARRALKFKFAKAAKDAVLGKK
jgi:DNA-binding protein HU-beta